MNNEFIVTFETSIQISEDRYKVINPSLKISDQTTIAEIEAFYRKYCKEGELQVTLIQLHQLK